MEKVRIKLGYVPTRRDVFSVSEAIRQRGIIKEKALSFGAELVDICGINDEDLLFRDQDVGAIAKRMTDERVDGLFFPHCNFGSEALVSKVAKLVGKPVLLWGPQDDAPLEDGLRTRDTQCGLFATGKVLRRFGVPYTYIVNSAADSEQFENGYKMFLSVCAVVKAFRSLRILQIGTRPDPFWTVICNEGELLEKFGVEVFPVSLQDLTLSVQKELSEKTEDFNAAINKLREIMDCSKVPGDQLDKVAAIKAVMGRYIKDHRCTAAAIQCWNALQDALGVMPCIANGILAEEGTPVACETDIHGAVSAILLQYANMCASPVFFADLTVRHPTNKNAELLWHCGNFPPSLSKNPEKNALGNHFILPSHSPGTGEWEIKGGDVTVCRFDGDNGQYKLFIGEGRGVEGPHTKGTYIWFEVGNWPKWEKQLVTGPYIHHCAGVHAKVGHILYEACKYIPGLCPDPAEPTKDELENILLTNCR